MSGPLLVVAGEFSGDMYAGAVLAALREMDPGLAVFGIGGDRMAAAGADLLVHVRDMAVFGPLAALARYGHFRRVFRRLVREAEARRPAAALLVDYGGFNLRLAAALKERGVPVIYYVSPQVWASRPGRVRTMARVADRLLVIFPFEPKVYAGTGLDVAFVGHPLVDEIEAFRSQAGTPVDWRGEPRVALLPGSRRQEIQAILPVMVRAAHRIHALHRDSHFLVASPDEESAARARAMLAGAVERPPRIDVVAGRTRAVLAGARAAMVASGTATVETALLGCPMVIVYKASPVFMAVARRMVKIPHIGMVNLIAGREVCPEFVQEQATGTKVATGLLPLLEETDARQAMLGALEEVAGRLGTGGAVRRVADRVASFLSCDSVEAQD